MSHRPLARRPPTSTPAFTPPRRVSGARDARRNPRRTARPLLWSDARAASWKKQEHRLPFLVQCQTSGLGRRRDKTATTTTTATAAEASTPKKKKSFASPFKLGSFSKKKKPTEMGYSASRARALRIAVTSLYRVF